MEFLINNWYYVFVVFLFITGCILYIYKVTTQPSDKQISQVEGWLLWAVTETEKMLGTGTGKLKFSLVYEKFVLTFPWIAKIVSLDLFSVLVDNALLKMRNLLSTNSNAAAIVNTEQK